MAPARRELPVWLVPARANWAGPPAELILEDRHRRWPLRVLRPGSFRVANKAEGVLVLEEAVLICLSLNYARKAIDVVPTARRVDQWQAPGFKGALDLGIPALARELLLRVLKAACGPLIRLRGRAGGVESLQVALLIGDGGSEVNQSCNPTF